MYTFMAYGTAFLAFIVIALLYGAAQGSKGRIINGVEYRLECVGTDVTSNYHHGLDRICGNMTEKEYNRLEKENSYYAWVKVGFNKSTWREEPINRELYFKTAKNGDKLPRYLQENGIMTKGQYIAKYGNKMIRG